MRAPILSGYGQTRPSQEGLAYRTDSGVSPEAFGAGIARGLGDLGESLVEAGIAYDERQKKTARFGALMGLSEFQVQTNEALTNLKRSAPVTGFDFAKEADKLYKTYEQQYLAKLPPNLVPEFQYRSQQIRQGVMGDALDFQYKQQDAFFVEGINTEYERAKNGIFATPDEYAKWDAHMAEVIASSDLPAAQKALLAREVRAGLTSVLYGRKVEEALRPGRVAPAGTTPASVQGAYAGLVKRGLPQVQAAVLAGNIEQESGGRPNAWNKDEGALGIIQWRSDRLNKLRTFAAKAGRAADDIDVQLDFLLWEGTQGGSPQDRAAWAAFMAATTPEEANAALKGYIRYGDNSQGTRLANAGKLLGIDPSTIKVGPTELESINSDPQFDGVPLEDRLAIQAGAQRKVDEEIANSVKAAQAAAEEARNALYVGLHDGTADEADLQAARNSGLITDVDDIEKAEKILSDRSKGLADQQFIEGALAAGGVGYGTQNNDEFNSWFKANKGAEAVAARDTGSFNTSVLPAVQTLQDIPTDLIGLLTSMSRSNDVEAMRWAYDRLLDLQDKAGDAFDARTPEALARRADQYRFMLGSATDQELNDYVRGGRNPQEIAINPRMDEQAVKILSNPESEAAKLSADITEAWDTMFIWEPEQSPVAAAEMQEEFRAGFINNFRATGDENSAIELTKTQLKRVWDVTQIGGRGNQLMRLPPHKVGYPAVEITLSPGRGSSSVEIDYDAIIRNEFGMLDDEEFMLVSDRQTAQELQARQAGETTQLPSYVVYKIVDGRPIPQAGRWVYP